MANIFFKKVIMWDLYHSCPFGSYKVELVTIFAHLVVISGICDHLCPFGIVMYSGTCYHLVVM